MGKFSGILICSDFDGTMAFKGQIPQANVDAIKYFQQNGGKFTVISGRGPSHFDAYADAFTPDGYMGCVNGTIIYDVEKKEAFEEYLIENTDSLLKFTLENYKTWKNLKDVMVFGKNRYECISSADENFVEKITAVLAQPIHKMLYHSVSPFSSQEIEWVVSSIGQEFGISQSWSYGMEIQTPVFNKGKAARKIAELLGTTTLICIGDYENDLPMLKVADIAYVAKRHHPALAPYAHRIADDCEVGAIASIVRDLENEI